MTLLSDLATLFAPYESGTKVPATGITIAGTDIADLYAPASAGVATAADTGIVVGATDIADLFAGINTTVQLSDEFNGSYTVYASGPDTQSVTAEISFNTAGEYYGCGRFGRYLGSWLDSTLFEILIEQISGDSLNFNNAAVFRPITEVVTANLFATKDIPGSSEKYAQIKVTIREIADPANKVEGLVFLTAVAESWGPSPFPP